MSKVVRLKTYGKRARLRARMQKHNDKYAAVSLQVEDLTARVYDLEQDLKIANRTIRLLILQLAAESQALDVSVKEQELSESS